MAGSGCEDPQTVSETVARGTGQTGGVEGLERRLRVLHAPAGWGRSEGELLDPHLTAELGMLPLPPLVLHAGHVGEVLPLDEHVARVRGLNEVDDDAIPLRRRGRSCRRDRPFGTRTAPWSLVGSPWSRILAQILHTQP